MNSVAEQITQDRIDILVDLAGHTAAQPPAGFRPQAGAGEEVRVYEVAEDGSLLIVDPMAEAVEFGSEIV